MVRLRLDQERRATLRQAYHVLQSGSHLRWRFTLPRVLTTFAIPLSWLPLAALRRLRPRLVGELRVRPLFLQQSLHFLDHGVRGRDDDLLTGAFVVEITERLAVLDNTGPAASRIELHAQQAVDTPWHVSAMEAPLVEEFLPKLLPRCAESLVCRELAVENVLRYVLEELESDPFGDQAALRLQHGARVAKHVEVLQVCVQRDSPLPEELR